MPTAPDLASHVLAAFEQDTDINLHRFPIQVSGSGPLRLEGVVEHIVAKRKARRLALEIAGNADIEDHLCLYTASPRRGKALMDAVVEALSQEPAFRDIGVHPAGQKAAPPTDAWIRVNVEACRIRLDGMVGSLSHRRLAEVICWWVPGVCDLHNHLRVRPAERDNDDELADAVLLALEKDPLLHSEDIRVQVRDHIITLHGTVRNEAHRRMAIHDCWYIPGTHDVVSELKLLKS